MGLEHFCSSEFYDSFPCGMSVGEIAAFGIAGGALALIAAFVLAQSVSARSARCRANSALQGAAHRRCADGRCARVVVASRLGPCQR